MAISVTKSSWSRWSEVIPYLANRFGFPASTRSELNILLRGFSGKGTTFRLEEDRWKFIIDVVRCDQEIISIVAITLIARTIEDPRHNGAVIARACDFHRLHSDEEQYVGAPALKWHMVTSCGMSFQHCCEKECSGPGKVIGAPRLTWETSRLKIIQKAYEQEIISMRTNQDKALGEIKDFRRYIRELEKGLRERDFTIFNQQKEIGHLMEMQTTDDMVDMELGQSELARENGTLHSRVAELSMENNVNKAIARNLRTELDTLRQQNAHLQEQRVTAGIQTGEIEKLHRKIERLERKKAQSVQKIKHAKATVEEQESQIADLTSQLESTNRVDHYEKDIVDLHKELEQLQDEYDENLNHAEGLANELKSLQKSFSIVRQNHAKEKAASDSEVLRLTEILRLTEASTSDHDDDLRMKVKRVENDNGQLQSKIAQLKREMEIKNEHSHRVESELHQTINIHQKSLLVVGQLRREMEEKKETINRLQRDIQHQTVAQTQRDQGWSSRPIPGLGGHTVSLQELENQRNISREAHEHVKDLESKLEASKKAMEDKSKELEALETHCADKITYTNILEKEIENLKADLSRDRSGENTVKGDSKKRRREDHERDSYIASLENDLEQIRGTMNGILRSPAYEGRKRRRTDEAASEV